jgi:hypothetical protein
MLATLPRSFVGAQENTPACRLIISTEGVPPFVVVTKDGVMAEMSLNHGGSFGFLPKLSADHKAAVVEIFDASDKPAKTIGSVHVVVGGEAVDSTTRPVFTIRLQRLLRWHEALCKSNPDDWGVLAFGEDALQSAIALCIEDLPYSE